MGSLGLARRVCVHAAARACLTPWAAISCAVHLEKRLASGSSACVPQAHAANTNRTKIQKNTKENEYAELGIMRGRNLNIGLKSMVRLQYFISQSFYLHFITPSMRVPHRRAARILIRLGLLSSDSRACVRVWAGTNHARVDDTFVRPPRLLPPFYGFCWQRFL